MKRDPRKGKWIRGVAHWVEGDVAFVSVAFTWRILDLKGKHGETLVEGARTVCVAFGELVWTVSASGAATVRVAARSKAPGLAVCPLEFQVRDGPELWVRTPIGVDAQFDLEIEKP